MPARTTAQPPPALTAAQRREATSVIGRVAREETLGRLGALGSAEVAEKGPGEWVTVADRRIEDRLGVALGRLLPGSEVVGEEAVSADPGLLAALGGDGPVWIIDPVDGTANLVAGSPSFATLVALQVGGRTVGAWTCAPALATTATAWLGEGTWVGGERAAVARRRAGPPRAVVTAEAYLTPPERDVIARVAAAGVWTVSCRCVGLEYVALARGRHDAAVFTWDNPWDHAAGLLLHAEAGGCGAMADGRPYTTAGGNVLPLLLAADPDLLDLLRRAVG